MTPLCTLTLDTHALRLADPVKATLTVEGPMPLVVTPPKDLLTGDAAAAWRVRPLGPATLTPLLDGHVRWTLTCRLDPLLPGDAVPVAFAPFAVTSGGTSSTVAFPVQSVKVQATVALDTPVRGITGLEELPPRPVAEDRLLLWPLLAIAVFALTVVVVLLRRRRPAPVLPAVWAVRQLATLTPESPRLAEQIAATLRTFVERQTAIPAPRLTTAELAARDPGLPVLPILQKCDAVKFAGTTFPADERTALLSAARRFVELTAPAITR